MKYSNELLESGLLNKFFPKASFYAVCDWLNKNSTDCVLTPCSNKKSLFAWQNENRLGKIDFDDTGEVCFFDSLNLCLYKPNLDNQFDSANQYD